MLACTRATTGAEAEDGMIDEPSGILVLDRRVDPAELRRLALRYFGDMVKFVVDVRRQVIALGGELHADAEHALLDGGSRQADLWGANYYPGRGRDGCIEFTALINIRPAQGNRTMEVEDAQTRRMIQDLTWALVGEGAAL